VTGRRPEGGRQLALSLPHEPAFGRDDFLVGEANRTAAAAFDRWPQWSLPTVLLVGPPGSGKSHLVAAWARRAGAAVVAAADLDGVDPLVLVEGPAVAVEDADRAPGAGVALVHLLNAARAAATAVVVTARTGPQAWPAVLPDLASRLRAATRLDLAEPDDALLAAVLVKLFSDRQIAVEPAVVDYIVPRMERSLAAANRLVAALDAAALEAGRPVTRPLAATVLGRWSSTED